VVAGRPVSAGPDTPAGTTVSAVAKCPSGTVLLGGGGQVTAPVDQGGHGEAGTATTATTRTTPAAAAPALGSTHLVASYPASSSSWKVSGAAGATLAGGRALTVTAYALCGRP
jgi:hypothetical protein